MRACNYTLSSTRINNAKPKGRTYKLTDGAGLFVEISPGGLPNLLQAFDERKEYVFPSVLRPGSHVGDATLNQPKSGSYPEAGSPTAGFGGPMTGAMRSLT